jgi:hypothetical protein
VESGIIHTSQIKRFTISLPPPPNKRTAIQDNLWATKFIGNIRACNTHMREKPSETIWITNISSINSNTTQLNE